MPRKPRPKWDDPQESKRFIEAAKAAGISDDPKAFERAFMKIVPRKPSSRRAKPASS